MDLILERAADIVQRCGWHQGGFVRGEWRFCALGAIRKAAAELKGSDGMRDAAAARLARYLAVAATDLAAWNDDPAQSADRVIAALRNASVDDVLKAAE